MTLVDVHYAFVAFCAAVGAWIFLSERKRRRDKSATDQYIAELRKSRALRDANRGLPR